MKILIKYPDQNLIYEADDQLLRMNEADRISIDIFEDDRATTLYHDGTGFYTLKTDDDMVQYPISWVIDPSELEDIINRYADAGESYFKLHLSIRQLNTSLFRLNHLILTYHEPYRILQEDLNRKVVLENQLAVAVESEKSLGHELLRLQSILKWNLKYNEKGNQK